MLPEQPDLEVVTQSAGYNVILNQTPSGLYLHSRHNPHKEALRQAQSLAAQASPSGPIIIIGCGVGYLLNELQRHFKELYERVYVIEPLKGLCENPVLQDYRQNDLGVTIPYFSDLKAAFQEIKKTAGSITYYVHPFYQRNLPDLIMALADQYQAWTGNPNASTRMRFIRKWLRNSLTNIDNQAELEFIKTSHTGRYEAAIYCGAGPTLFADLDGLGIKSGKKYANYFVIASDTALPVLLERGYQVDVCICIDAGPGTWFHLSSIDAKNLPLDIPVLTWLSGPEFCSKFFKKRIYYKSTMPLDQILAQGPLADIEEWINSGNNQSGLALLLAHSLSIPQLHLAGNRFISHGSKTHINGTGYQTWSRCICNRLNNKVMYQPGGYGASSEKNRIAKEALTKLELQTGVIVRDPASKIDHQPISTPTSQAPFEILTQTILRKDLVLFLKQHWHHIDKHAWDESGMPNEYIQKGQLILENLDGDCY